MKSGKFINLNVNEQFKCGYGTVDSKNLKSIYSKITCWIEPTNNVTNWNTVIGGLKRKISGKLTETLNITDKFKKDRFIVDLDIRTKGIKLEKRSFIHNYTSQNEIQLDKTEINTPEIINIYNGRFEKLKSNLNTSFAKRLKL